MRFRPIFVTLSSLVIAAGCLGDTSTNTNYPIVPIENTTFASSLGVNLAASTKTASGLYYRDIRIGTGKVIANGDSIRVKYSGAFANGVVFDANTFPLRLPAQVIQGWNEGLLGVRIGGSRQLIIPSSLGYGDRGSYPDIPPNATLVFTVEPLDP